MYFTALAKLHDYVTGRIAFVHDSELVFTSTLPSPPRKVRCTVDTTLPTRRDQASDQPDNDAVTDVVKLEP
jgi:hypothetical protein